MSERITEEQAVVVAELLDEITFPYPFQDRILDIPSKECKHDKYFLSVFKEWLYSAEGQEALMDRLFSINRIKVIQESSDKDFYLTIIPWGTSRVDTKAKTRQHALLQAIWVMIKGTQEVINHDNRSPQEIEDAFRHAKNVVERFGWKK